MNLVFNVEDLVEGLTAAEDIFYSENRTGTPAVAVGVKLTQSHINKLIEKGVKEVTVSLNAEEKQRYEVFNNVLGTIDSQTSSNTIKSLEKIKSEKGIDDGTIREIVENSTKIVNSVLASESKFTYRLTDYKLNREPSAHSVRVAAYATAFAQEYNRRLEEKPNITQEEIKNKRLNVSNISLAALLHDVGKTCEDEEIRSKLDNISFLSTVFKCVESILPNLKSDEYNPKYAPLYGYNIIHGNMNLPTAVKLIVLLSGENNKFGPLEASKNILPQNPKIKFLISAKIINFCSSFDEILLDNVNEKVTLENANDKISALAINKIFDEEFLDILIKTIPLYPIGTKVKLQGKINDYAIVSQNFQDSVKNYTRPVLRILSTNEEIDLRETYNTTIKEVVDGKDEEFRNFMNSIKEAIFNDDFSQRNKDDDEPSR